MLYNNLPLYQLDIDSTGDGVDFVALVDRPAIEKNYQAFNEAKKKFTISNEDRRIISGPLMLADTPIYRNDDNGEYYVVFTKDTIEKIVQNFFAKGFQNNVNLMHDDGQAQEGISMFESFISDESRGVAPMKGYEDAPEGSWFGSFKVNNDTVWSSIKEGKFLGFSVEGLFQVKPADSTGDFFEELDNFLKKEGF